MPSQRRSQLSRRLDVPVTIRELYPRARSRGRLHVRRPGTAVEELGARRSRIALRMLFTVMFALPVGLLTRSADLSLALGEAAAGWIVAKLFRVDVHWQAWQRWSYARGGGGTDLRPAALELLPPDALLIPNGPLRSWRVIVGRRGIGVQLLAAELRGESATMHAAYLAFVELPVGAGARLGDSSFVRRAGLGALDLATHRGQLLELESERLVRGGRLLVDGDDELAWRQLFDPALVDLLADELEVEWVQRGDRLVLHVPAPSWALTRPDSARLDALCAAAAAIERRFATVAADGSLPLPPVAVTWLGEDAGQRVDRHLARERARDLTLDPEALFAELARFADESAVADVRRKVDAGSFPLELLDDLVHHRRAAFWAASDADAA